MNDKAPWITYRPELKVLDCTIRDGGLVNNSNFSDEQVRAVYEANVAAGVDYMEIGYKNNTKQFPTETYGPWRHCKEETLERVIPDHDPARTGLKIAVMADAGGKCDWEHDIIAKRDSLIDMVRVACYSYQISEAAEMVARCHELGYETMLNIMAISVTSEAELDQCLEIGAKTEAGTIVVVDSYGNLYREQVDALVMKYQKAVEGTGKEIGIHAHNNMQLAFANTIEAIILGVNRVDATMMGLGRGAGNCPMELLLGFLRNPKFDLRPVLDVIQNTILPIRQEFDWGPSIPYNLTGQYNAHPRAAMGWRDGETPDDYLSFYDKLLQDI